MLTKRETTSVQGLIFRRRTEEIDPQLHECCSSGVVATGVSELSHPTHMCNSGSPSRIKEEHVLQNWTLPDDLKGDIWCVPRG